MCLHIRLLVGGCLTHLSIFHARSYLNKIRKRISDVQYGCLSDIRWIHLWVIRKSRDTTHSVYSLIVNPTLYCNKQHFPRSKIIRGAGLYVAIRFTIVWQEIKQGITQFNTPCFAITAYTTALNFSNLIHCNPMPIMNEIMMQNYRNKKWWLSWV